MGMWMSKAYEAELMTDAVNDLNEIETTRKKAKVCEQEFQRYCAEEGIERSCHIPREQGPDISIMTEIVFDQNSQLFARKPDGEERSDPLSEEQANETELKVSKSTSYYDTLLFNKNNSNSLPRRSKL